MTGDLVLPPLETASAGQSDRQIDLRFRLERTKKPDGLENLGTRSESRRWGASSLRPEIATVIELLPGVISFRAPSARASPSARRGAGPSRRLQFGMLLSWVLTPPCELRYWITWWAENVGSQFLSLRHPGRSRFSRRSRGWPRACLLRVAVRAASCYPPVNG